MQYTGCSTRGGTFTANRSPRNKSYPGNNQSNQEYNKSKHAYRNQGQQLRHFGQSQNSNDLTYVLKGRGFCGNFGVRRSQDRNCTWQNAGYHNMYNKCRYAFEFSDQNDHESLDCEKGKLAYQSLSVMIP